jgi:hypothetical protein
MKLSGIYGIENPGQELEHACYKLSKPKLFDSYIGQSRDGKDRQQKR